MDNNTYQSLVAALFPTPKRKVFISYHHKDQEWINGFKRLHSGAYDVFTDCSLDQAIGSSDLEYVNRQIREEYIDGTSITIVVCGTDTWRRMCVDWEIYSTLHKNHALLGLILPHNVQLASDGAMKPIVPARLHENIASGYAHWIHWTESPHDLRSAIELALNMSKTNRTYKNNSAPKMARNK